MQCTQWNVCWDWLKSIAFNAMGEMKNLRFRIENPFLELFEWIAVKTIVVQCMWNCGNECTCIANIQVSYESNGCSTFFFDVYNIRIAHYCSNPNGFMVKTIELIGKLAFVGTTWIGIVVEWKNLKLPNDKQRLHSQHQASPYIQIKFVCQLWFHAPNQLI